MKAIVLTHDKNIDIADHMILKYHQVWPDHPFEFYIPYQSEDVLKRPLASAHNKKHIRTNKPIIDTVLGLLEGINPNEWVYWCPDDKFPIKLITKEIQQVIDFLPETDTRQINRVSLFDVRMHTEAYATVLKLLEKSEQLTDDTVGNAYVNLYPQYFLFGIFLHHFIRVGLLRWIFKAFPSRDYTSLRRMDDVHYFPMYYQNFLTEFRFSKTTYMYKKSLGLYAESMVGGDITLPCYNSMKRNRMLHHKQSIRITKEEKGTYYTWISPDFLSWHEKIHYLILPRINLTPRIYVLPRIAHRHIQNFKVLKHKIKRVLYLTLKRPIDILVEKFIST